MLIKLLISGLFESTVSLVVGHVLHIKCYLNNPYGCYSRAKLITYEVRIQTARLITRFWDRGTVITTKHYTCCDS